MSIGSITEPTLQQKQQAFQIIEEELNKTKFKRIAGKISKDSNDLIIKNLTIQFSNPKSYTNLNKSHNFLDKIFNHLSTSRYNDFGQLFHFKSFDIGLGILKSKELKLFSLESQSENDYAEHSEYHHKYSRNFTIFPNDTSNNIYRKDTFIFCFTKNFRNNRFWKEYAKNDTGIAFGFSFSNFRKNEINSNFYQLRDVFYDNGYDLDFINEIRAKILRRTGLIVEFNPYVSLWFPYYYKRIKYQWEDEVRLSIYTGDHLSGALSDLIYKKPLTDNDSYDARKAFMAKRHIPNIETLPSGNRYISLPFENPYFDIQVTEVICGRKVTKVQIDSIIDIVNPEVKVWKRP